MIYFLAFAGQGLHAYFNTDDLVNFNIYASQSLGRLLWSSLVYFTPAYRPLGGLFYKPLFDIFGLNPLPFRVVCFLLLGLNLRMVYCFGRLLTGSREAGVLAALLIAFHPRMVDLYWSNGTIYDILCFSFYLAALNLYWRSRASSGNRSTRAALGVLALYICALDAKEMAATLPVMLALGELICFRSRAWKAYRLPIIAALMTVPYVWGKLGPLSPLSHLPSYHLHPSLAQFFSTYGVYLNAIFYRHGWFTAGRAAILLGLLVLLPLRMRSRGLWFAWCFLLLAVLPIAFIPPRGAFAFYLPFAGWCLYVAIVLVKLREGLAKSLPEAARVPSQAAFFLLVLALLVKAHHIQAARMGGPEILRQKMVRSLVSELDRQQVRLPRGARVLVSNDPFPPGEYGLILLLRLYVKDPTIEISLLAPSVEIRCAYTLRWLGTTLETFHEPASDCPWSGQNSIKKP